MQYTGTSRLIDVLNCGSVIVERMLSISNGFHIFELCLKVVTLIRSSNIICTAFYVTWVITQFDHFYFYLFDGHILKSTRA